MVTQTQVCPPVWLNSPVAVPVTPPECTLKEHASFRSKFSLKLTAEVQAFCELSLGGQGWLHGASPTRFLPPHLTSLIDTCISHIQITSLGKGNEGLWRESWPTEPWLPSATDHGVRSHQPPSPPPPPPSYSYQQDHSNQSHILSWRPKGWWKLADAWQKS